MKKFWKLENAVESSGNSTLILEGVISSESWWGDEVTPQAFREELKSMSGDKLTVIINSGGGDVFAGVSIYNALRELDAEVTVRVDGLAASIASIIAMAGDKIVMSPGSMMMIHKPSVFAAGNADELEKALEMLNKVEESLIPIYTERTGLSTEKIVQMLEAETWLTAEESVQFGFADEVAKSTSKLSETIETPQDKAFKGKLAFSMSATKDSIDSFVHKVAEAQAPTEKETKPVSETTTQPTDEVVTAPTTPVVEPAATAPVETQPTNEKKETPQMSAPEEIAQTQVLPAAQAPVDSPAAKSKEYLKSKQALNDFAGVLAKTAGGTPADFKAAWANHLEVKMGITNPEVLLPPAVIRSIEDAFAEGGEIWNLLNKTGLDVFSAAWDTVTGEDSRAKGYNRSVDETKNEEVITIASRVVRPQFIYKYLTLPKEVVKEQRSTGALLSYVLSELPKRIVREVERAAIIGDGRTPGTANAISSFVSVKADATAENVFATTYTPGVGESTYESLLRARALVKAEGAKYLIAKTGYVTSVLLEEGVNGGFLFAPGTNIAQAFGFAGVITPDWFDDTSDDDNDAYIVTLGQYRTVGDNSIESFTNFQLSINKNEYLQEIWAGGALTARDSAVAIAKTPAS